MRWSDVDTDFVMLKDEYHHHAPMNSSELSITRPRRLLADGAIINNAEAAPAGTTREHSFERAERISKPVMCLFML